MSWGFKCDSGIIVTADSTGNGNVLLEIEDFDGSVFRLYMSYTEAKTAAENLQDAASAERQIQEGNDYE